MQWVDPPAIDPYQQYINYLEDVVIFNLRQELVSALASPDPTSTNDDDGPVTGPMVVKTNTWCEDEFCYCPCHEKKDNTPPATPPRHRLIQLHPRRVLHALPTLLRVYDVRVIQLLFVQLDYKCFNHLSKFPKAR
jgi:hypothetical protein